MKAILLRYSYSCTHDASVKFRERKAFNAANVKPIGVLDLSELYLLIDLRKAASRAFDRLGLSTYEAVLLLHVDNGVRQPAELARLLDIQQTATSALITKLAGMGLITRTKNGEDARVVNLRLTIAGCETVQEVGKAWVAQRKMASETTKRVV